METLIKYLKQSSTWMGLVGIASGFGLTISPELATQIAAAGVALVGLIAVIVDEDKKKDEE